MTRWITGGLIILLSIQIAHAGGNTIRWVAPGGTGAGGCTDPEDPCGSIGFAVQQAESGDRIHVQQGTYAEAIVIDENILLQGDYEPGFRRADTRDPNRTVIDGKEAVRPVTVVDGATVVLDGFRLTNGNASDSPIEGVFLNIRFGGGLLVTDAATLVAIDLRIDHNVASTGSQSGFGGGVAVVDGTAELTSVVVEDNVAKLAGGNFARGGGLYASGLLGAGRAVIELNASDVDQNFACASPTCGDAAGGGLFAGDSTDTRITLLDSRFSGNVARTVDAEAGSAFGGGLAIVPSSDTTSALLEARRSGFSKNVANASDELGAFDASRGGAVYLDARQPGNIRATLEDVEMADNIAKQGSGVADGQGGGLWAENAVITWERGSVTGNRAAGAGASTGSGGGIRLSQTPLTARRLTVQDNRALIDASGQQLGRGGGIAAFNSSAEVSALLSLTNVFLVDNLAAEAGGQSEGAGLFFGSANLDETSALTHVTVAQRASVPGDDGIHITGGSLDMTNLIVAGFVTGVRQSGDGTVELFPTNLFQNSGNDTVGAIRGSDNIVNGDPSFVGDPQGTVAAGLLASADFHITAASDAIDRGSDAGVTDDIDGEPRPQGAGFDIGGDEYPAATPTVPPTASATPSSTEVPTPTSTDSPTPTFTEVPTPTFTDSPTPTFTEVPTPTFTGSPTPTFTEVPTPTFTNSPTPTFTEVPTPIIGETSTPTATDEETRTPTPTAPDGSPTRTPMQERCVGDCDEDGQVTVDELVRGVSIALGGQLLGVCPEIDGDGNGRVAINELVTAVNRALSGCPAG